jgi:hypothetical protein
MKTLPKRMIDLYKSWYGLAGWKISVRLSARKSANCGETLVRRPYNEATITLFPREVRNARRDYPYETVEAVLHHEFAHVLLEARADEKTAAHLESDEMLSLVEATVEHIATVIQGLVEEAGVDEHCKLEGF